MKGRGKIFEDVSCCNLVLVEGSIGTTGYQFGKVPRRNQGVTTTSRSRYTVVGVVGGKYNRLITLEYTPY
jgi:hypothetical protein